VNAEQAPSVSTTVAVTPGERAFEEEAATVLQRLRTALAEIIGNLPGHVTKPAELRRLLRVDMNLCCKILKVIAAPGALAAGLHLPGIMALRMFLNAARKAGVRESVIETAMHAADEFDQLVTAHADDRTTFDSMISSLVAGEDAAQITFQHRRATFRGQRHLFGLQARVQLKCLVAQPSPQNPHLLDLATITGFVSLRRLRPGVPVVVSPSYTMNDDGSVRAAPREPLDPTANQTAGVALLPEFCTQPMPQLQAVQAAPGRFYGELVGMGIGNKAAITCVEGHVNRSAVPRYREQGNQTGAHLAEVRIPCETLLLDLMLHEDICNSVRPSAFTYTKYLSETQTPNFCAPWQRLEPQESVAHLGKRPSFLYTPDYPRYPELGRYVFKRLGWDSERFDVYRCRIEYPVVPSTTAVAFNLPEPPGSQPG
jgi:hypothetical protein